MEIKNIFKQVIFQSVKRSFVQLIISGFLAFSVGLFGIPFKIYTLGTESCTSIGCGSGEAGQVFEANLAANLILWYVMLGILYSAYARWKA